MLHWQSATDPAIADEITLLQVYKQSKTQPQFTELPKSYNQTIYQTTDKTGVKIGQFVRHDVAELQGLESVPVEMRP